MECDYCGDKGVMLARYDHYTPDLDLWTVFLFCDGKCSEAWLSLRNHADTAKSRPQVDMESCP